MLRECQCYNGQYHKVCASEDRVSQIVPKIYKRYSPGEVIQLVKFEGYGGDKKYKLVGDSDEQCNC